MWPWTDRAGRIAPFRAATFALLFVPALWILARALFGDLGARPYTTAIHLAGLWTFRFVLVALAISPLREAWRWPTLMNVRRMIGVASFAYGMLHLGLYAADQAFDLTKIATEIAIRIYLTIGFVALLGLAALAATSTDGMVRRLGGRRWRNLHRLAYPIAILGVVHFFMQSKLDPTEPAIMGGILGFLFLYRMLAARFRAHLAIGLAGLAIFCGAATLLGELGYFNLLQGFPADRILDTMFGLGAGIQPPWWVLMAGLAVATGAAVRGFAVRRGLETARG